MKPKNLFILTLALGGLPACGETPSEQTPSVQIKDAGYSKGSDRDAVLKEFSKRAQTVKKDLTEWKGQIATLAENVRTEAEKMIEDLGRRTQDLEMKIADAHSKTDEQWASFKTELQTALKSLEKDAQDLQSKFQLS